MRAEQMEYLRKGFEKILLEPKVRYQYVDLPLSRYSTATSYLVSKILPYYRTFTQRTPRWPLSRQDPHDRHFSRRQPCMKRSTSGGRPRTATTVSHRTRQSHRWNGRSTS